MATKSAHAPVPAPPPDAHFDENRSVYGFFRRHQKKLLYTAGFFTLLTFSITGPLLGVVHDLFGTKVPMASIVVGGEQVKMQPDDYDFGRLIAHNITNGTLLAVLPPIALGEEGGRTELPDALAILRRAAIAEGIEPSLTDVDRAIAATVEHLKAESAAKLARNASYQSLDHYRQVVAEAMRIGTYVRLQTLVLDTSDANVLQQVLKDREKITLKVATYDEVAAETRLKAARTMSEEDLKKWMESKNEAEKNRLQIYDKPRWQLHLAALLLAEDQFDPAQWQADALKDFTVGDDQLRSVYEQERDARFKVEGKDGEYKPFEDAAVKAELTRLLQAEQVMRHLLDKLRPQQTEALKPQSDEVSRTQAAHAEAERIAAELKGQEAGKQREVDAKAKELEQKPDDATLKQAHDKLTKELTKLKDDVFQYNPVVEAKKRAVDEAETALKEARAHWDFPKAFAELTKDKKGVVLKTTTELRNADQLKDLDKEFELGQWATAANNYYPNKGDLCAAPGRTTKAVLLSQAIDLELRPLKDWEKELRKLVEDAYWTEQAKEEGVKQKKVMEEALLRLGKAKTDKVAEIEGKRQTRVDEKLAAWEKTTQEAIADAEKVLGNPKLGQLARGSWQQKLDGLKAQLGGKEQRRKDFDAEVGKEIEKEIAAEARKFYGQVLEEAATEAGFTVATIGPHLRDLQQRPRFDKTYDHTVVFLMRSQSQLKIDETTDVLVDSTNRRMHVATCTKVEPATAADITRREFEALRSGTFGNSFADMQAMKAYEQAFTLKALETRYELQRPGESPKQ